MRAELNNLNSNLSSFKKKYYLNLFIRGSIFLLTLVLAYFLLASVVEYNLWLSQGARFFVFASFFVIVAAGLWLFLKDPISWWIYKKGLKEEESAKIIGSHFPTVSDRLLNVIQLSLEKNSSPLLEASLTQKSKSFESISFDTAIDLTENRRYLKYLLIPFALIVALFIFNQNIFTQSASRIVHFNEDYAPQAPFQFEVKNENLNAYFNEDFTLQLTLTGNSFPEAVYIVSGVKRLKMESVSSTEYSYTFEKIQTESTVQFEGSGFYSKDFTIHVISRPELSRLKVKLNYPKYLNKPGEELTNAGNLEVPEGTIVTWQMATSNAKEAFISFASTGGENPMQNTDDQMFSFTKNFNNPDNFTITLSNENSKNKDKISYNVAVIKDQFPEIVVDQIRDSILFKNVMLGGSIADDYGVTVLTLNYQVQKGKNASVYKSIPVKINPGQTNESFYYEWKLDSLGLGAGDQLSYYLQVWDNDGINGHKSTRSANYTFALPSKEEMKSDIAKTQSGTESSLDKSVKKAKELGESIDEANQKLKGKQTLDFQDKKMLENMVEQKQSLDKMIEELKKQNKLLEQKKDAASEQNESLREKSEQLQKLMDELLDPETKKLFEELEKLMQQNPNLQQIQDLMNKMDRKELNLEKELERALELFKQMQFDYKLDQAINEIKEEVKKQEEILEETKALDENKKDAGKKDDKNADDKKADDSKGKDQKSEDQKAEDQKAEDQKGDEKSDDQKGDDQKGDDQKDSKADEKTDAEELAEKQDELNKEFEEFEKSVAEIDSLGKELDKEGETPSKEQMEQTKQSQQQSKQSLQQGKPKSATKPQEQSLKQMKEMQQQMEGMQSEMEMEMNMENLESMRQIVHGLIKLSYDQEGLMKDYNTIAQNDPKYIQVSQNQLKVKDDAKILEDSLLSLASRDPFMGTTITREIAELDAHVDKSVDYIKDRRRGNAASEMQFSMTTMNNLALMLDDHLDAMMEMMANSMPQSGKGKGKKKGQGQGNRPSLGQMQQQLNQDMQRLKNGQGQGRQFSEELARMAAEQERIRRAYQELLENLRREGSQLPGNDIQQKMEETETDLVNKRITQETILRQKDILVKLLDAENSMREQSLDEKRKGETAKDHENDVPRIFEEYLKLKEKELDLLKTVPPKLYPYYKKEVNNYFKRIGTQE
jgi:hypothetical protein